MTNADADQLKAGDPVQFRPDRAAAYNLSHGTVYHVVRTFRRPNYQQVWVVLSGLPDNDDGTPPTVKANELLRARHRANAGGGGAPYGWIITRDHLHEKDPEGFTSEKGTAGPRDISDANYKALQAGKGKTFTMRDDDNILYYTGRIIGEYEGTEPLDDFGTPNAGATSITVAGERIV